MFITEDLPADAWDLDFERDPDTDLLRAIDLTTNYFVPPEGDGEGSRVYVRHRLRRE